VSPRGIRNKERKLEVVNMLKVCRYWCDENVEENVSVGRLPKAT